MNKQVEILNNYLINVCLNYIQNKIITINDKEPPWITSTIHKKILESNSLFKSYTIHGRSTSDFDKLQESCQSLNSMISESKNAYYDRIVKKLNDPKNSPKVLVYFEIILWR